MRNCVPIFLIGMRFSGKTTLGNALAQKLQWDFVDTDTFIQKKAQCTIAHMVAEKGWNYFRNEESSALQHVTKEKTVIATGGGMVLASKNREFMRNNGLVIFLAVPLEILYARLSVNPNPSQRPPLTNENVQQEQEMRQIFIERAPLYESAAHFTVDAGLAQTHLAEAIYEKIQCFYDCQ